ncbi:MAG: hypothetical protein M3O41_00465 [Pseudomonadota bacterium]|nr:hypothetical protein [Pseudomonadota bacterium]
MPIDLSTENDVWITDKTDPKMHPSLYPRMGLHTITEHTSLRYDTANDRLVQFLTRVSDEKIGHEVEVGWDVCGRCLAHVNLCVCDAGCKLPSYIIKWNGDVPAGFVATDPVTPDFTTFVKPEGYVKPVRDPRTGRKIRKDKGKSRDGYSRNTPANPTVHSGKQDRPETLRGTPVGAVPATPQVLKRELSGPCALHTAESKRLSAGTYECTVPGCQGVS